jgi:hypothetical protein
MTFLNTLILAFSFQGGLIPTNNVSLYPISQEQIITDIKIDRSYYTDLQIDLEAFKYFHFIGGMTSYQWGNGRFTSFYPFRMDFNIGAEITYKSFTVGYAHACFHPISPSRQMFDGVIDALYDNFYFRVKIKRQIFN